MRSIYPSLNFALTRARDLKSNIELEISLDPDESRQNKQLIRTHVEAQNLISNLSGYLDWNELIKNGIDHNYPTSVLIDHDNAIAILRERFGFCEETANSIINKTFLYGKRLKTSPNPLKILVTEAIRRKATAISFVHAANRYAVLFHQDAPFLQPKIYADLTATESLAIVQSLFNFATRSNPRRFRANETFFVQITDSPETPLPTGVSEVRFYFHPNLEKRAFALDPLVDIKIVLPRTRSSNQLVPRVFDCPDQSKRRSIEDMATISTNLIDFQVATREIQTIITEESLDEFSIHFHTKPSRNTRENDIFYVWRITDDAELEQVLGELRSIGRVDDVTNIELINLFAPDPTPGRAKVAYACSIDSETCHAVSVGWVDTEISVKNKIIDYTIGISALYVTPNLRKQGLASAAIWPFSIRSMSDVSEISANFAYLNENYTFRPHVAKPESRKLNPFIENLRFQITRCSEIGNTPYHSLKF